MIEIKNIEVFNEVPCLTEYSSKIKWREIQKKWHGSAGRDKFSAPQQVQKFISINKDNFEFLGVSPIINDTDQNTSISFKTSSFIGSIPLRAADTGKQIGDFVVMPRYTGKDRFEDYIEILNLLGTEISPESIDSLPLASGKNFRPPLYLEAVKFIAALEDLVSRPWRKFDNIEIISDQPTGQINWTKYLRREYKVENRLKFPVRANILSEFHKEYSEIRHVFNLCKNELLSANTPPRIKNNIRIRLNFLEEKLYQHKPILTNRISIKFSDRPSVKKCKVQANKILNFKLVESTAWRVDFSDVFEKFIQHIFRVVANESGGRLFPNYKFRSQTKKYFSWELKHIEPDAIYQKENILILIDAKYKSNLYNKFDQSEFLKEDHRHDLHQILAYSSFNNTDMKFGFLCYPSDKIEIKPISYKNGINETTSTIMIFGVPLKIDIINEAKIILTKELNEIERKTTTR